MAIGFSGARGSPDLLVPLGNDLEPNDLYTAQL